MVGAFKIHGSEFGNQCRVKCLKNTCFHRGWKKRFVNIRGLNSLACVHA